MRQRLVALAAEATLPSLTTPGGSVWDESVLALTFVLQDLTEAMIKTPNRVMKDGDVVKDVLLKLSLQSYRILRMATEVLNCWGVVPFLLPGVSVPPNLRPTALQQSP